MSSDGKPATFQPPPKPVIIDRQQQREERRWGVPALVPVGPARVCRRALSCAKLQGITAQKVSTKFYQRELMLK